MSALPNFEGDLIPRKLKFTWDSRKNKKVKQKHGKSFEEILHYILAGKVVSFREHFNQKRYPGQMVIILDIEGYPWVVPCELKGDKLKLITAYPCRKFRYLLEEDKSG